VRSIISKRFVLATLTALAVVSVLDAPHRPAPAAVTVVVPRVAPVPGTTASWMSVVRRDLMEREYRPTLTRRGIQAPNRAQNLRARFLDSSVRIAPRVASGPAWGWTWRLGGWGRTCALEASHAEPRVRGARVEYVRPGITEWYENGAAGLEQGFTIAVSPRGEGPLLLRGTVGGGLTPRLLPDGSVRFCDGHGASILAYGGLMAVDAEGKRLPALLTVLDHQLTIRVEDARATYPVTIDPLLTSPSWTAQGAQAGESFGLSVATAGDVNGDGYSDVLVGAPSFDNGQADLGEAFLYLGSRTGPSITPAPFSPEGNQSGAQFASAVAPAGDINGDGYGDLAVGAPGATNGQNGEGRVVVYYGGPVGFPTELPPDTLESNQALAAFGASVAPAGDVNGDGFDDLLIGAPKYANGQVNEGRAYLFLGGSAGIASTPQWTAEGDQDSCSFAASVATAGDVNGDGFDDIVVGAPLYDNGQTNEGRAYVYLGSSAGLATSPARTLESNQVGAQLGASVSTAGDVNGDGYADLLVGAPLFDNGQIDEGAAFLYLGSSAGTAASASWTAESNQASAQLGASVSTAGDVNGDGYADVIVGAPLFDNGQIDEGRAFTYLGSSASLATTAAWTAESDQAGARFGASVAAAGDVNGDGYGDVVVGAPLLDGAVVDGGKAFLYVGSASGPATIPAWSVSSFATSVQFGFSVSSAGDVNGDGYGDIIVGAVGYDVGGVNAGAAFVYFGSATGPSTVANWSAQSNQATAQFGNSVASAGDVNGDGYDDVLIGAPLYTNGQNDEGAIFLYYGSSSGLGPNGTPANADFVAEGNQSGSRLGVRVASAGDLNGDGFADIVAGAYTFGGDLIPRGRAYVYLGSASGPGAATTLDVNQDNADFGYSVASAGDVNGDGFSDILVSARHYSNGQTNEGRVYLYNGSRNGLVTTPSWQAEGDQDSTEFGYRVASAGDVNGDGYSDVIIGAPFYDNGQNNEGKVFVYLGSRTGLGANGTPLNADWTAESDQAGATMGSSVASAGDVNGDGYGDIIVGASQYDHPEIDEGAVFVYYGSATGLGPNGTPANADWTADGNQTSGDFGIAADLAGDVNGDGYPDLIVGSDLYDTSQAVVDNGRAVVFYGNAAGGLNRIPRQARVSDTAPISVPGRSDSPTSIRLKALGRSAAGRTTVRSQWEVTPTLVPFDGLALGLGASHNTGAPVAGTGSSVALNDVALGRGQGSVHHWRLRTVSRSPYFPHGPWFSPAFTTPTETHVRTGGTITGVDDAPAPLVARIESSRPNPTEGPTTVTYSLRERSPVRLAIYDVQGREIVVLVDRMEDPGRHAASWSGRLPDGSRPASGVYFAKLRTTGLAQSRKIILIR